MKENINVLTENVVVISVQALDFKTQEGSSICGYNVHYYTEPTEREKNNIFGKKYGKIFFPKERLDDIEKYKNHKYPFESQIHFEVVSLDKKPKPIKIML